MSTSTIDVIDRGMRCLSENIGARDTEIFIATILKERFDYTKWRRSLIDTVNTFEELDSFVEESEKRVQFNGMPKVII